jgi:hypothetical protein
VMGGENPETGGVFDDTEYVLDAAARDARLLVP